MDDSFLVRMLNSAANLHEQRQTLGGRQVILVAIISDPDSAHQFHDEEGPARLSCASLEHTGDIGVIHQGQCLTFSLEPRDDSPGIHAQLNNFESDSPAHGLFLLRHVDDAATALADLLEQLVAANSITGFFAGWERAGRSYRQSRLDQEVATAIAYLQEGFD